MEIVIASVGSLIEVPGSHRNSEGLSGFHGSRYNQEGCRDNGDCVGVDIGSLCGHSDIVIARNRRVRDTVVGNCDDYNRADLYYSVGRYRHQVVC
ncbi:hypothetical protein ES703_56700 [subsurface metagenome]